MNKPSWSGVSNILKGWTNCYCMNWKEKFWTTARPTFSSTMVYIHYITLDYTTLRYITYIHIHLSTHLKFDQNDPWKDVLFFLHCKNWSNISETNMAVSSSCFPFIHQARGGRPKQLPGFCRAAVCFTLPRFGSRALQQMFWMDVMVGNRMVS